MLTDGNIKQAIKYCKDDYKKIPGYERAVREPGKFLVHHVLELTLDGQFAHTTEELEKMGMYWKRPYYELQWMSLSDHMTMHSTISNPMSGNGEKVSNTKSGKWKGDSVGPIGKYKRALKKFKNGEISELELSEARAELQLSRVYSRKRKRKKNGGC